MRKLPTRKLLVAVVAAALFLPNTAFTLGLGEIEVNSALNQRLKAEIELLSATPEDTENLIVKLASRKQFTRAGLDRPFLLNDLRFKSEVVDGVAQIKVSSGNPIREPFLNFLVEIDWPNGHLLREYTILLDPPVFMTQQPAIASAAGNQNTASYRPASSASNNIVPVVTPGMNLSSRPGSMTDAGTAPSSQAVAPQPTMNPAFVPAPYVQQQSNFNQPANSYRIKQGDTAWSLADAMRPDQSITVEQMMIAMLRTNPESFIGDNINGLKRGYILRVPDYNQIVSIKQEDARALVREQAALWRQYQQTHAGGQPASAMPGDDMATTYNEDGVAVTADDAYLEIVSAGSGSSTISGKDPTQMTSTELRAELALARERVETERVEKEALLQRIGSLEQNIGKMKGMLSIEDEQLADIQQMGLEDGAEDSMMTEGEMLEAEMLTESESELAESIAETDDMLAEQHLDDAISEESLIAEDLVEEDGTAVFLDETAVEDEMAEADDSMSEQATAVDAAAQPAEFFKNPPTDPLSKLMSDPMLLAGAGGGLLLILALIGLVIKKRRDAADEAEEDTLFDSTGDDALDSLADDVAAEATNEAQTAGSETTTENFDSNSTMILDGVEDTILVEEDATAIAEDDEPRDDVIAEADVYLAYGIYQQAEELLTQAISDNPERDDYRVKLAETHYASKNSEAFVEVATEIKTRAGDDITPAWKKVMVMGQDLCADNALFQGSMVGSIVGGLDIDALSPKAPEMDFDLGLDDAASPDLDLSLDEEPLELPEMDLPEVDNSEQAQAVDSEAETAAPEHEIEFDLSDTDAVEEAAPVEDEFSLDIDASELDIDNLDEELSASKGDEILDLSDDIDIDFGLDEEPDAVMDTLSTDAANLNETAIDETVAIDISDEVESLDSSLGSDLDMDLSDDNIGEDKLGEDNLEQVTSIDDDEEAFDLSNLDDVDEISTKLDLARAYLDMGDHEGTRDILEEVLTEGSDEQKQEASDLIAKLD